jgi:hypothetical protein
MDYPLVRQDLDMYMGMKNGDKEISIFYTLKLCGLPMFPRGFFKIPSPLY